MKLMKTNPELDLSKMNESDKSKIIADRKFAERDAARRAKDEAYRAKFQFSEYDKFAAGVRAVEAAAAKPIDNEFDERAIARNAVMQKRVQRLRESFTEYQKLATMTPKRPAALALEKALEKTGATVRKTLPTMPLEEAKRLSAKYGDCQKERDAAKVETDAEAAIAKRKKQLTKAIYEILDASATQICRGDFKELLKRGGLRKEGNQ